MAENPGNAANFTDIDMENNHSSDVRIRNQSENEDQRAANARRNRVLPQGDTKYLRQWLRLLFYPAIRIRGKSCVFNFVYVLIFLLQLTKLVLVTTQMYQFGADRQSFSSIVNRGHIVLRHLFLQYWDSTWETLPYPPSRGDFAVYNIQELRGMINFAVSQYYNAEEHATGFYVQRGTDNMTINFKYFDFPGFNDSDSSAGLKIYEETVPVRHGLKREINSSTLEPYYTYNILEEFAYLNLTQPFKRLLSVVLRFSLHSVRVYDTTRRARCLNIQGWISFVDDTNNGQVLVDLETLTSRLECASIGYNVEDADLLNSSGSVGKGVIALCSLSLIVTIAMVVMSAMMCVKTKRFMGNYYRVFYRPLDNTEYDLPLSEYIRFFKMWDYITIISDCFTLYATNWIVFGNQDSTWVIETLDSFAVLLSVGGFATWVTLLRFFKFHNKFYLLFATLNRAMFDVMAYLLCVVILFIGFVTSGYVVMAPYHVKFSTPEWSAETLISVVNGDEMFFTMNILEVKKTGGDWVLLFSRFYFGAYIAVFTIVVINLLVAIFMSAYEAVRAYYSQRPEDRDLSPVEIAIKNFLEQSTENADRGSMEFRSSIRNLLNSGTSNIGVVESLRVELGRFITFDRSDRELYVFHPRTLKAFVVEKSDEEAYQLDCIWFKLLFHFLPRRDSD